MSLLIVCLIVIGLIGCGKKKEDIKSNVSESKQVSVEETTIVAETPTVTPTPIVEEKEEIEEIDNLDDAALPEETEGDNSEQEEGIEEGFNFIETIEAMGGFCCYDLKRGYDFDDIFDVTIVNTTEDGDITYHIEPKEEYKNCEFKNIAVWWVDNSLMGYFPTILSPEGVGTMETHPLDDEKRDIQIISDTSAYEGIPAIIYHK